MSPAMLPFQPTLTDALYARIQALPLYLRDATLRRVARHDAKRRAKSPAYRNFQRTCLV